MVWRRMLKNAVDNVRLCILWSVKNYLLRYINTNHWSITCMLSHGIADRCRPTCIFHDWMAMKRSNNIRSIPDNYEFWSGWMDGWMDGLVRPCVSYLHLIVVLNWMLTSWPWVCKWSNSWSHFAAFRFMKMYFTISKKLYFHWNAWKITNYFRLKAELSDIYGRPTVTKSTASYRIAI